MNFPTLKFRWLPSLASARAMLFGVALVNLVVVMVQVVRIDRNLRGSGFYVEHWNPLAVMFEPFLLLIAAICLLINHWWSLCLALLAAGRVVYQLGFLSWTAVHDAHDVPMFSWQALEKLWYVIYQPRPQYLFEVALAAVLFFYAIFLLGRFLFSKSLRVRRRRLTGAWSGLAMSGLLWLSCVGEPLKRNVVRLT